MDHWQRNAAYGTGCLVIGLALVVFTHNFFHLADLPGFTGYFALFAYWLVYFNFSFLINRRFMLKAERNLTLNYFFSFLTTAPTLGWIFTKDTGLEEALLPFVLVILFGAFIGTFFGIKQGRKKRNRYIQAYYEEQENKIPDELKRPHDDLSNN